MYIDPDHDKLITSISIVSLSQLSTGDTVGYGLVLELDDGTSVMLNFQAGVPLSIVYSELRSTVVELYRILSGETYEETYH